MFPRCFRRGSFLWSTFWNALHCQIDAPGHGRVLAHLFEVRSKPIIEQKLSISRTEHKWMKRFTQYNFL